MPPMPPLKNARTVLYYPSPPRKLIAFRSSHYDDAEAGLALGGEIDHYVDLEPLGAARSVTVGDVYVLRRLTASPLHASRSCALSAYSTIPNTNADHAATALLPPLVKLQTKKSGAALRSFSEPS